MMKQEENIEDRIKNLLDYELNKGVRIIRHGLKEAEKFPNERFYLLPDTPLNRNYLYKLVADQLGIHKVLVRKVARKLMVRYIEKWKVLNDDKKRAVKPNTISKEV